MWKLRGQNRTPGVSESDAFDMLKEGLLSEDRAYIYHCWNHYFCPMGFEMTPARPEESYLPL